ncbi:hypothetical protein [Nonomuraea longicatena]|uniref:Uncharacterized protein n=1 Tax=Nonomuraea longicatena TaxID=83682 RepID=A0ABN1NXD5_9ACTN
MDSLLSTLTAHPLRWEVTDAAAGLLPAPLLLHGRAVSAPSRPEALSGLASVR